MLGLWGLRVCGFRDLGLMGFRMLGLWGLRVCGFRNWDGLALGAAGGFLQDRSWYRVSRIRMGP